MSLLLWAASKSGPARYLTRRRRTEGQPAAAAVTGLGDAADSVLRFIESGAGADALALAVVCQVVFGEGREPDARRRRRPDGAVPRQQADPQGRGPRAWAGSPPDAVADLDRRDDPRLAQQHLQRADELLRQFRCEDHAYRSRLTLLGYEQRLARFGAQVEAAVDTPGEAAIRRVRGTPGRGRRPPGRPSCGQAAGPDRPHRDGPAARPLARPGRSPAPRSFAEMADAYRKELAFVDWARESVCRGDEVAGLSEAYQPLDRAVLARREEFNRAFAAVAGGLDLRGLDVAGRLRRRGRAVAGRRQGRRGRTTGCC